MVPVLAAIEAPARRVRSPARRESLLGLRDHTVVRLGLPDDRTGLANGTGVGSGPTEAPRKTLTLRLNGSGMKWGRDYTAALMNLTAMCDSGQADASWAKAA